MTSNPPVVPTMPHSIAPRRRGLARAVLSAIPFILGTCLSGPAAAADYWTCKGGKWAAVGTPTYPRPMKTCGAKFVLPETRAACLSAGGQWQRAGLFPQPICRMTAHDAGRTCGDNDECEGSCLGEPDEKQMAAIQKGDSPKMNGTCTPVYPVFGCMTIIHKGRADVFLCVD